MTRELAVDTDGLRSGAADSAQAAAELLAGSATGPPAGARASETGVAAVDAAISELRVRQADRISGQAGDMWAASTRYDGTDGGNADDIAVTM